MTQLPPQQAIPETSNHHQDVHDVTPTLNDLLLDENFSVEFLLKQARDKNLNLRQLRDQLVKHQQDLEQSSTEIFNNSYDRFFKLSQLIVCLAEPIQHVINPIENYRNRLSQLCQEHDKYLQEIDTKLAALEETNRNKLYANRFIVLIRRRDRIFDQLNQIEWLKRVSVESILKESNGSIEAKVKYDVIERLSFELYHLGLEIRAIQPTSDELISIKKLLQSSVDEQQALLGSWLSDVLHLATQLQNTEVVEFISRQCKIQ